MIALLLAAMLLFPIVGDGPSGRVEPSSRGGNRLTPLGEFTITAYALRGITRSGVPVGPGVAAADTDVLPLGTVIEVDGMGTYTVLDTGSGVIARHIDLWFESYDDAIQWGCQTRQVWQVR